MIHEEIKEVIKIYASKQRQINLLKDEIELMRPSILEFMMREKLEEIDSDVAKIVIREKREYKFPEEIEQRIQNITLKLNEIEAEKKELIARGEVECEVVLGIAFNLK
jgi:hypothetical protein